MASLDDYDEFGNYIGADLDSDDEDDTLDNQFIPQPAQTSAAPLEGYDEDEPMPGADEGALMEVDGAHRQIIALWQHKTQWCYIIQSLSIERLYCTRTSSIIPLLQTSMAQM